MPPKPNYVHEIAASVGLLNEKAETLRRQVEDEKARADDLTFR